DRITAWDVVNEAVNDDGELRESVWLDGMGERYIEQAFRYTASATDAQLFYNDYGLPYNEEKRERVHDLLATLLDRGVPIDGIGLQLHCVGVHPGPEQVRETIERFQELGLTVRVSELDVAYEKDQAPDELEAAQAQYYRDIVQTCLDTGVSTISWWGVLDNRSWITTFRDY
ncbi:MAG: endo-1,4-beta-xylanase, partial [Candidatus Nanohaloarchaea archaeon]|nr:endo-1,4-beta-xylanase [Candidatus Nanohaloarchaea archaeon]